MIDGETLRMESAVPSGSSGVPGRRPADATEVLTTGASNPKIKTLALPLETSLNETLIQSHTMSFLDFSPVSQETIPPLDSPQIHPQLRVFLQFMLHQNMVASQKILEGQMENAKRLDALEKVVYANNQNHIEEFEEVKLRISSVEFSHNDSMKILEDRISKVENSTFTSEEAERVALVEDRQEAQEKASKQNNLIIRGLALPQDEVREGAKKFLLDNFNYSGLIFNAKPLGRDPNNNNIIRVVALTLESLDDKLKILRNKRARHNLGNMSVHADLTKNERKCVSELGKFARKLRPDGKGVSFGYQKLFIGKKCYTWDIRKNAVVECSDGLKVGRPPSSKESGPRFQWKK